MRVFASRLAALLLGLAWSVAGAAALGPGNYELALAWDGLQRSYLVHVPPQASGGGALPVVINFHGAGSTAEIERGYTRMDAAADRDGYIAVYPNGSSGFNGRFLTWNAGTCCGPAALFGVDDVGFVRAMLDDLAKRARIDPRRVYATGLSNGAMMAYRVAAEASDRIAAVAGVAGVMALTRFAPTRAMPVMHIHSTSDHIARYDGGFGPAALAADTRVLNIGVEEMVERWLGFDACPHQPAVLDAISGRPGTPDERHTAIKRVYAPCRDGAEVVVWQLGGGVGHVWPGGIRDYDPELLGEGTAVIDANTEIWKFFSRFTREKAGAR